MKILLVDDEQLQLLRLNDAVKKVLPDAEIFSYNNPMKALEETAETPLDLAFLDIEMPGLNGIQLAKKLKTKYPLIKVIFVTAYSNYALYAYRNDQENLGNYLIYTYNHVLGLKETKESLFNHEDPKKVDLESIQVPTRALNMPRVPKSK